MRRASVAASALLAVLLAGCAETALGSPARFSMVDAQSGARIRLRKASMQAGATFAGRYLSPQLGELTLTATGAQLSGTYRYEQGGCVMSGRVRGEHDGNLAELRFAEDSSSCAWLGTLTGRAFLFFDPPRVPGAPAQLFGRRAFHYTIQRREAETVLRHPALISAQRIEAVPRAESSPAPMTAPPPAGPPPDPQRCGLPPRLPLQGAATYQARIASVARALTQARERIEARCSQVAGCDRDKAPWRDAFMALRDAELWLISAQAGADRFTHGDRRALDLSWPCLGMRLDVLSGALRDRDVRAVEGLYALGAAAQGREAASCWIGATPP